MLSLAPVVFMLKAYVGIFVMMWARGTLPRIRVDQLLSFGWKVLIPVVAGVGGHLGGRIQRLVIQLRSGAPASSTACASRCATCCAGRSRCSTRSSASSCPSARAGPSRTSSTRTARPSAPRACSASGRVPDYVIKLEVTQREDRSKHIDRYVYEVGACMMCGLCVEACPFDAIYMSHEYELATVQHAADLSRVLLEDVDAAPIRREKKEDAVA